MTRRLAILGLAAAAAFAAWWYMPSFGGEDDPARIDQSRPTAACEIADGSICDGASAPQIAASADGKTAVVVWTRENTPDVHELAGRIVNVSGEPVGDERRLWPVGSDTDIAGRITAAPNGGYRISWAGTTHAVSADLKSAKVISRGGPVIRRSKLPEDPQWHTALSGGRRLYVTSDADGIHVSTKDPYSGG